MNQGPHDYLRHYALIDFGNGRKLESFAGYVLDRPSPAASKQSRHAPQLWQNADARFAGHGSKGQWSFRTPWPAPLELDCGSFRMPIVPKPFGHVGFFPEHAAAWTWCRERLAESIQGSPVLNLFAYTGAGSLALGTAGAAVVHVDAARPSVAAAKEIANRLDPPPAIRFIVDDAMKFCQREVRRGRRYRLIMLDPPSFGHGPRGTAWRIERDVWPLLELCVQLLDSDQPSSLLVGGHSPGDFAAQLRESLQERLPNRFDVQLRRNTLTDRAGRRLDCGYTVTAAGRK